MLPIEDWAAACRVRHSRRAFRQKRPIPHDFAALVAHCDTFAPFEGVRVSAIERPVTDVFTGIVASYGKVHDAPSVLVLVGDTAADDVEVKVGYTGEAAVLEATRLGFATCWVAGLFNRRKVKKLVELGPTERVFAVSAVGYALPTRDTGERVMQGLARSHVRRQMSEIAPGVDGGAWPAWAFEGVLLARLAPSAMNRQPWHFRLEGGAVVVSVEEGGREWGVSKRLDCGIAMLHFELGALTAGGVGGWELLPAPDVARYTLADPSAGEGEDDGDA